MRYIGEILGENRKVNFNFEEKRRTFVEIYNYLCKLSESDEFWDMLNCNEEKLDEYSELVENVHLKFDGYIFDMQRNSTNIIDTELVSKKHGTEWYSTSGLRKLIIDQLKFISKNTYFKLYNDSCDSVDRLHIKEIKDV